MGVDIVAIVRHNYSVKEIVNLPERINSWTDIHEYHKKFNDDKREEINAIWDAGIFEVTEKLIKKEWEAWKSDGIVETFPRICCSFANFKVNRHTINICPSWMHKYGNLYDFFTREYVMNLMRMIAHKIDSNRIIYCPDSACSTSILEEKSRQGCTLEEIEEYGISTFGRIPLDLTNAVYNYFYIDDLNLNLNDYNNEKYLFNRCNEEYFLEQKFGEKFIIKRN